MLINHASSKPNREILVLSAELSKMRLTVIKDFIKLMQMVDLFDARRWVNGTLYRFPNGSFIKFIGLDKSDVGKGLRSHIAYFNEANKTDRESYRQVASRCDNAVFIDYNPDAEFWVDTDILVRDDVDFLQLTFKDNELLGDGERYEIENYYTLGYDENGDIINDYWANMWRVYGLGEIGSVQGVIFSNWKEVDGIPVNAKLLCYGVDFGFSISKFACVAIYQMDGNYYFDELVYENDLTNPDAANKMIDNGYVDGTVVYCDYAEPKSIEELRRSGINAVGCESKNDIKNYAIKKMNEKTFFVNSKSINFTKELRHWKFDEKTGKPEKSKLDHLMDAVCYGVGSEDKYNGRYI